LGGVLHISEDACITFFVGLGPTTKKLSELMARKLTSRLEKYRGITYLNVYRDSLLVINWINGTLSMNKYYLHYNLLDIQGFSIDFSHITFSHVYREQNAEVDSLSKNGLVLERGS
jgi:uncharacterized membrane protein YesL